MSDIALRRNRSSFSTVGDILTQFNPISDKYISREFQKYGYDLACELDDLNHKTLYIKMSKELPRVLLEQARSYVKDAHHAKSKAKLFMWKVQQLKKELQQKLQTK